MKPGRARPISVALLEPLEQRLLLSGRAIPVPGDGTDTTGPPAGQESPSGQTQASVSGVDQGQINAGWFAWQYRYHISLVPEAHVLLETYITLTGAWTPDLRDTWEQGIEQVWSGRYEVLDEGASLPIVFDVHFNGWQTDHSVQVSIGVGQTTMTDWHTADGALTAAHEVGHMLGLFDEYRGGAVDPAEPLYDSSAIMGGLVDNVHERYYQRVLFWLEDRTGRDMSLAVVPMPADVVALEARPGTATAVDEITLTATVSEMSAFPAARVEFYLDTDGNQALDPETDQLLGIDTNGQDGWVLGLPSGDLPVGSHWIWARAGTAGGLWGQAAAAPVTVNRDAPDLAVAVGEDVIFPPFGRAGWLAVVPVLLRNLTSVRAAGEVEIRILADPTTDAEGDEVLLGRFDRTVDLAGGQETALELRVTLPGSIAAGDYFLRVELDAGAAFPQADLANDLAYSAVAFGFNLPEPIQLPAPVPGQVVPQGQSHVVVWTGGSEGTTVSLRVLGPRGWQPIGQAVPSRDGEFRWDTTGWGPGWHGLLATIDSAGGLQNGEFGWLGQVKIVAAAAPSPPPAPAPPEHQTRRGQSSPPDAGSPAPSPPAEPDAARAVERSEQDPVALGAPPARTAAALLPQALPFRPARSLGTDGNLDLPALASPESLLAVGRPTSQARRGGPGTP